MIVGSSDFKGAQMTDYQSSVCNMAVQHKDRVVFTGYIDNMNLYRYHKSADIAVVPSICEEAFNIAIFRIFWLREYLLLQPVRGGWLKKVPQQQLCL